MANSTLQNISEIFNNRFFRIPDYQRGYAWEESQLTDFWNDVYYLSDNQYHYTGLITVESITKESVLTTEKWKDDLWLFDKGYRAYYIIDGQQRLLTIMIMLKVLLNKFKDDEEVNYALKTAWYDKFFFQKCSEYDSFIMGYEKDNPSDNYYRIKILDKPTEPIPTITETLYTVNLNNAKKFFEKKVQMLPKDKLQSLFKKLINNLKFNFYEIDDELDECVTFETMNNRGKPLSKLEILKNRLIYLSTLLHCNDDDKRQLRRDVNNVWKTIYEYLGKNLNEPLDDDEFLENHWRIYFKYTREEGKAFSKFLLDKFFTSTNIISPSSKETEITFEIIKNYIFSLSKCVVAWFYVFNPQSSQFDNEVVEWLDKLKRSNNKSMAPLVMAAIAKNESKDKLLKLLKAIERFNFLIFEVTDRKASTGNSHFYSKGHDYYHDDISITELVRDIKDFVDNHQYGFDIKVFTNLIESLFSKDQEGFYSWGGINYFLYEYELYLQKNSKGDQKVDWKFANKSDSIEHIFPQNPKANSWGREFTNRKKSERSAITHSLGNLVLIATVKNSELKNESFEYKKKHINKQGNEVGYFNGSYSEIEVAQQEKWYPESIYKRGLKMLDFMEIRWDVEIPDKDSLLNLQFLI